MNTSSQIDISKSSLVGLRAELLRKQEEVKRLKDIQQDNVKRDIIPKKKLLQQKSNDGIGRRRAKDTEVIEEDYNVLQKSREVLEAKSRLYDKLRGNTIDEETKSKYLIDFDLKRELDKGTLLKTAGDEHIKHSENEEDFSDSNSDPENDWVDFLDTLGRSRRCLRKDLPDMRHKDAKLAESLHPPSPPPNSTPTPTPELLSWDMQREMMRKKWEEQETHLLDKKDIHYQDIRFDEARPHGVGYFEFSTDEAERARQQEELQKLRTQTKEQQEAAQGLRVRRQQQMQARLAAARQRRRERLGLPPESPPHEAETLKSNNGEQNEGVEEESIIDLVESVKKIAPVRPWDIGKNGVAPVMSQEEWIKKKRQERPEEFAPPSSITESISLNAEGNVEQKWKSNPNVFKSKREKQKSLLSEKSKCKHKISKGKKGEEEIRLQEEKEDGKEGPSVKDWQEIQQRTCTVVSDNTFIKLSNVSSPECAKTSPTNNSVPTVQSKDEDFIGPSVKGWKPTITDIDLLLSKSRAAGFNTSVEEEYRNHEFPQGPMVFSRTQEPSLGDEENIVKHGYPVSSSISTNVVKSSNFDHHKTIHSKRKNYQKGLVSKNCESFDNSGNSEAIIKPIVSLLEVGSDNEVEISSKKSEDANGKWKRNKRKFSEIPPPPSMLYYMDTDKKIGSKQNSSIKPQLADSISAGINYLKSQTEEKSKKRLKGLLDII